MERREKTYEFVSVEEVENLWDYITYVDVEDKLLSVPTA